MLASRGLWSLVFFVAANWNELSEYITARGNRTADQSTCPKEEEEQVHLNLALQKEIVRFTGLGIQKAVKDINDQLEAKAKMSRSQKRPSFLKVSA